MNRSFQQKRSWKKILHSVPVLIFFAVLALIFASSVFGLMRKMLVTVENKELTESKVAELEEKKRILTEETEKLKTADGIEASIREKFPVAKEGEGVIVVIDDKKEDEIVQKPARGFLTFLADLFR